METKILSIFTRTPLHVGAGSSVGAIDMPIIRERHTRFPVIPGSSIKGVLADLWLEEKDGKLVRSEEGKIIFGNDDTSNACAGAVAFGEAKLLAFPVRSARGCFAFITCPLALQRFARDMGLNIKVPEISQSTEVMLKKDSLIVNDKRVIFEEYSLKKIDAPIEDNIIEALKGVCSDNLWKDNIEDHIAIVSDELFSYFVENACEIANHNCVDDKTGVVEDGALFCQENVPSETVFYSLLNCNKIKEIEDVEKKLKEENNLIQVGADETTGLGWCSVYIKEVK